MTAIIPDEDVDIVVIEDDEPQRTCQYRYMDKTLCGRPAYVSAQLNKPCGHFNPDFLICQPHWVGLIGANGTIQLHCGRCGQSFDLKSSIVSWDLI